MDCKICNRKNRPASPDKRACQECYDGIMASPVFNPPGVRELVGMATEGNVMGRDGKIRRFRKPHRRAANEKT